MLVLVLVLMLIVLIVLVQVLRLLLIMRRRCLHRVRWRLRIHRDCGAVQTSAANHTGRGRWTGHRRGAGCKGTGSRARGRTGGRGTESASRGERRAKRKRGGGRLSSR